MNAFKTILLLACVVACAVAEPPRRRSNFKSFKFARQEVEDSGSTPEEQPPAEGYNYQPPAESQRLRLPAKIRVTAFARQEEATPSNGYHYPKPDSTYGPPTTTEEYEPEVTTPNPEYGVPEEPTTTAQPEESTDQPEEPTTTNPQAEQLKNVRAAQLRRQNGKSQKVIEVRQQQQQRRVQRPFQYVFFQYPVPTDFEQQYIHIFK